MQRKAVEGQCRHHRARPVELERAADDQPGIPPAIAEHLRSVHDQKIGYEATLRVIPGVTDLLDPTLLDDPVYAKVVPPAPARVVSHRAGTVVQDARSSARSRTRQRILGGVRAANAHWATSENGMRALRHLYELGQPCC